LATLPRRPTAVATLNRLFGAAEALFAQGGNSEFGVGDVARQAGLAVGTLYTRFEDKDSFLRAFWHQFYDRALSYADESLSPARWAGQPLAAVVRAMVTMVVRNYRQRKALLCALTMYVRGSSDQEFRRRAAEFNARFIQQFTSLILERRDEIAHPEPWVAVRVGLTMVDGAAKERILFDADQVLRGRLDDDRFIDEMTRAFVSYLRGSSTSPPSKL
jgi:AcrR family transcriptional regulator